MTPTDQDNELREQVADALRTGYHGIAETKVINHIMQLITADRKRVALEARIDEAKLIAQLFVGLPTKTMKRADLKYYLINRIAELKAQQEEV